MDFEHGIGFDRFPFLKMERIINISADRGEWSHIVVPRKLTFVAIAFAYVSIIMLVLRAYFD